MRVENMWREQTTNISEMLGFTLEKIERVKQECSGNEELLFYAESPRRAIFRMYHEQKFCISAPHLSRL
jgi:hypothetical protein